MLSQLVSFVLVAASNARQEEFVPVFKEHSSSSFVHDQGYTVVEKSFISQTFPLLPGQMVFTKARRTPITMPTGRYAVLAFFGDIGKRDPNNSSAYIAAPLTEVYDHHWIVESNKHTNPLCNGKPKYVFGIGAESRNTHIEYPDGYGMHIVEGTEFGGNIHILRTEYLSGDNPYKAKKECNECYYADTKNCAPSQNGSFTCCGETCFQGDTRCRCPTVADAPKTTKDYVLRYTLRYTTDVAAIKPVTIGVITTPDCELYYNVLRNDTHPEQVSRTDFPVPHDARIMLALGHQHTGALNISLFHNGGIVCTSYPTYGKQRDVAGDELGHLVAMSPCIDGSDSTPPPLALKKGDTLSLESWYYAGSNDTRLLYSDGTHLNLMGYMYMAIEVDK